MKRTLQHWLIPVCICSLLGALVVKGERWVSAQSQDVAPPFVNADASRNDEDDDSTESTEEDRPEEDQPMEDESDSIEEEVDGSEDSDEAHASSDDELSEKVSELDHKTKEIVAQIHEAISNRQADQAKQLKEELTNLTREYFDLLESQRRTQIASLERKLETLRQVIEAREQNADQIVQRRVKKLLGESDTLDWNPRVEVKESWRGRTASRSADLTFEDNAQHSRAQVRSARNAETDFINKRVDEVNRVASRLEALPPLGAVSADRAMKRFQNLKDDAEMERARSAGEYLEMLDSNRQKLKAERDRLRNEFETVEKKLKDFK